MTVVMSDSVCVCLYLFMCVHFTGPTLNA